MAPKEQTVLKQLFLYVGPAVLGLLVNALYNIVDRIFVGQFVGADGLSAVTMVFPITLLKFGFVLLFGSGAGVLIAKYLGESDLSKNLVIPPKINYKDIAAKSKRATIFVILIIGFTAGPAVSLYGSPTVSPVTAAL